MKILRYIRDVRQLISNKPVFATSDIKIGHNVRFGKNVIFNCKKVRIGDGVIFQDNVTIESDVFRIVDYGTIYQGCFFPGPGKLTIGHNFWIGASAIVDCQGGTTIGNNVGIGAQSQLWTHIQYGDMMYGCRFSGSKPLIIEDDVWIVGHCLSGPVTMEKRSMAMLGSLITTRMNKDRTYAGVPAVDVTEKFGPQFEITPIDKRKELLTKYLSEFAAQQKIEDIFEHIAIETAPGKYAAGSSLKTAFNIADRAYIKRNSDLESALMRFL